MRIVFTAEALRRGGSNSKEQKWKGHCKSSVNESRCDRGAEVLMTDAEVESRFTQSTLSQHRGHGGKRVGSEVE